MYTKSVITGFVALNTSLAAGAGLVYLMKPASYTTQDFNIGAGIAGGLFMLISIFQAVNYCYKQHKAQQEQLLAEEIARAFDPHHPGNAMEMV